MFLLGGYLKDVWEYLIKVTDKISADGCAFEF
jgi:hypothetical protein